jgi:hypothetical protein
VEVAAHGEVNGLEVPCLLIAAKDDLEPDPSCVQNAARVWSNFLKSFFRSSFALCRFFEQ